MNEISKIWKPIKNYEHRYLISNLGDVKTIKTNKILKPELRRGYLSVQLFDGIKYKHFSIHRLVAITFIDNPKNYLYINHKDENKQNNTVNNLEWCTASYNVNYGTAIKRAVEKKSQPVYCYTKDGIFVRSFPSVMDAERITKIWNSNITNVCNGKRKTAGGFIWSYIKL